MRRRKLTTTVLVWRSHSKRLGAAGADPYAFDRVRWRAMSVEFSGGTVTVRKQRPSRVWGAAYLLAGGSLIWLAAAQEQANVSGTHLGVAFGLLVTGLGLHWLLPAREALRLDITAQLAHEVTYAWMGGRQLTTVPFADVASIGRETYKDPRNGAVWWLEGVLRLKDGRRLSVCSADDAETAGKLAGLPVDHQIVLMEEPATLSN